MRTTDHYIRIFQRAIEDYHVVDHVDHPMNNPIADGLESMLYEKCWIDTVQWHLEDLIRHPEIDAGAALEIKRRIDKSNQARTDLVEQIDVYILENLAPSQFSDQARLPTESPAWAIDRLSILCLKIYHMKEQVERSDASDQHRLNCSAKLEVLQEQLADLTQSIDDLLIEIGNGQARMKLYRQMKMYNDPNLNPVLYKTEN